MFTVEDIKNIAIQIEENGEKTYRQVSEEATDPEIKEIFSWMADEERRHANWFRKIESLTPPDAEQQELAQMGKNLLQEMVKDQTFSLDSETLSDEDLLEDMLEQSIVFENDTALFYEFIGGLVSDNETLAQLKSIIEEEGKHAQQLQDLIDGIRAQKVTIDVR